MRSTTLARRAAGVSAGALSLCLLSSGVAFADTSGLPPLPSVPSVPSVPGVSSPNNVITTLDQTVKQVTTSQPTTNPPTTSTPSGSTGGTTTATKQPATKPVAKPAAKPAVTSGRSSSSGSTAGATTALPSWSGHVAFDAVTPTDMALPPATGISAPNGSAPAVAPLLMPQTQHVSPSAALAELDKHSGSPLRGILLGLAIAATVGLGYGHLRAIRD